MSLSRTLAIFVRQLFLLKSNPTRLVSIFLWLIIDIIQWGFISKYLGSLGEATFGFVTVALGAIILWEFMSRIENGIMMAFLEDVWSQNLINFFASPLKGKGIPERSRPDEHHDRAGRLPRHGRRGRGGLRLPRAAHRRAAPALHADTPAFRHRHGHLCLGPDFPARAFGGMAGLAHSPGAFDFCRRLLSGLDPAARLSGPSQG